MTTFTTEDRLNALGLLQEAKRLADAFDLPLAGKYIATDDIKKASGVIRQLLEEIDKKKPQSIGAFCETHQLAYTANECPRCFKDDPVNHPKHYTSHPSGVECIQVTEHLNFCLGNAVKYIWRAGEKDQEKEIEDLEKGAWYLAREIARRKKAKSGN